MLSLTMFDMSDIAGHPPDANTSQRKRGSCDRLTLQPGRINSFRKSSACCWRLFTKLNSVRTLMSFVVVPCFSEHSKEFCIPGSKNKSLSSQHRRAGATLEIYLQRHSCSFRGDFSSQRIRSFALLQTHMPCCQASYRR